MCASAAGEVVDFSITVVNTGNLKLTQVTLTALQLLAANMTCKIGTAAFANRTSVLDPKAVLRCTAGHKVSTADIEAGNVTLSVAVTANSVLGQQLDRDVSLQLTPVQISKLDVSITNCQSLRATAMPGECVKLSRALLLRTAVRNYVPSTIFPSTNATPGAPTFVHASHMALLCLMPQEIALSAVPSLPMVATSASQLHALPPQQSAQQIVLPKPLSLGIPQQTAQSLLQQPMRTLSRVVCGLMSQQ